MLPKAGSPSRQAALEGLPAVVGCCLLLLSSDGGLQGDAVLAMKFLLFGLGLYWVIKTFNGAKPGWSIIWGALALSFNPLHEFTYTRISSGARGIGYPETVGIERSPIFGVGAVCLLAGWTVASFWKARKGKPDQGD
jgi:hypothetical protein